MGTNLSGPRVAAFILLLGAALAACSSDSQPPGGLAFAEEEGRPTNLTCSSADISMQFPADTNLADDFFPSAGPFSIAVPAGEYTIFVASWMGAADYKTHTMEQWYFTTDTGYTSPMTTDSSPSATVVNQFDAQVIAVDVASITLFHKLPGMEVNNSVSPLCIGFTVVPLPATTTSTTTTTTTTTTPTTTTAAPTTTTLDEDPSSGLGAGTVSSGSSTTTTSTTTTTAAPTTTTSTSTTTVAVAAPKLALTGPSDLAASLGLLGASLILAGVAALKVGRRREN